MASGTSPTGVTNTETTSESPYPVQRHAGKVGYGPNFATGAGLVDKITGLMYEVKGKVTHDPALVHHGHEVFTGEAKRKKILGIEDKDPVFDSGHDSSKQAKSDPTPSPRPPSGTVLSKAEPEDRMASASKYAKEHAPENTSTTVPEHVISKPAVEHLQQS